jgi:hypothetical protein
MKAGKSYNEKNAMKRNDRHVSDVGRVCLSQRAFIIDGFSGFSVRPNG